MGAVTLTITISLIGAFCAVLGSILAVSNLFRASRKEATTEAKADATCNTRLETKLDYVSNGIDDIRLDIREQGRRMDDITQRVTRVEENAKSAQHRIDGIECKIK